MRLQQDNPLGYGSAYDSENLSSSLPPVRAFGSIGALRRPKPQMGEGLATDFVDNFSAGDAKKATAW